MYKRIPGTKDITPEQVFLWQSLEAASRKVFSLYNYHEIRTPILEDISLFTRSLGEVTEIVQKQMFLIKKEDDTYALRPEGTAAIVRAYLENNLDKVSSFLKLYYMGPMFRMERPQKGRFRQFHHIGCEVFGSYAADVDVEVIAVASRLLAAFAVTGYTLKINSLGCANDKSTLAGMLRQGLAGKRDHLCPDCQVRFDRNVLRILDCKQEACKLLVAELKVDDRYLCSDCKVHFSQVRRGLDALGIQYQWCGHLVRGLDYYTRTVFEFVHPDLGSQQDAVGAGGRYDTLVETLGGPPKGAVGFAFGVERLILVTQLIRENARRGFVYCIALGDEARMRVIPLVENLRKADIPCDTDYENKSLKAAMRKANDAQASFVVLIGDEELKKQAGIVKVMATGEQADVAFDRIAEVLKQKIAANGINL